MRARENGITDIITQANISIYDFRGFRQSKKSGH
jgi:hypothetical protein